MPMTLNVSCELTFQVHSVNSLNETCSKSVAFQNNSGTEPGEHSFHVFNEISYQNIIGNIINKCLIDLYKMFYLVDVENQTRKTGA